MTVQEVRQRVVDLIEKQGRFKHRVAKEIGVSPATLTIFMLGGNASLKSFEKIEKYLENLDEEKDDE